MHVLNTSRTVIFRGGFNNNNRGFSADRDNYGGQNTWGNQGMMNGRRSSNEGQGYGAAQQNGPSRWDALAGPAPGGNNNRWDNRSDRGRRDGGRWDGPPRYSPC